MLKREVELAVNQLRNLAQYKGLSEVELIKVAETSLGEKKRKQSIIEDLDIDSLFTEKEDKKIARNLAYKYITDYNIETISDRNTLIQLIQLEILHFKLNTQLNDIYANKTKDSPKINLNLLIESIHKNINEIGVLKERLGIAKDKQAEYQSDAYRALEILKKKFKTYLQENQASRTLLCPHCQKMILLKIKTDKYDAIKHPFFRDRVLCNTHLIRMYANGKITKEDIVKVLGCSEFYINWLITRYSFNPKHTIDPNQIMFDFAAKPNNDVYKIEQSVNN